jgi:hypothetical protein
LTNDLVELALTALLTLILCQAPLYIYIYMCDFASAKIVQLACVLVRAWILYSANFHQLE